MKINDVVAIVIAVISSGVISTIIGYAHESRMLKKNQESGERAGIRILLYDRIKHLGKKYISEGKISAENLEDLIEMHRIYHVDLDGNGFLDSLMEQVKKLPIIND